MGPLRPSRLVERIRLTPAPLAALLAAAAVLSLAWTCTTAPLTGFDEADHVAYTARLASSGEPPTVTTGEHSYSTVEKEAYRDLGFLSAVGNAEARPPWHKAQEDAFRRFEDAAGSHGQTNGEGPNPLAKNPPLYYAYESIPWLLAPGGHFFGRVFAMRLGSGLLFLITVALMWLLAGEVFRRTLPRTVATGVVALHPLMGFMSGIVNTDNLLVTTFTLLLWLALRTIRLGPTPARATGLGVATAAVVLTHGRGIAAVPVLVVALAAALLVHRPPRRETLRALAAGAGVLAVTVALYALLSSRAGAGGLYGGEVSLTHRASFNLRQLASLVWQFYLPALGSMQPRIGPDYGFRQVFVETFFGSFASYEVLYPRWVFDVIQIALVGGAAAFYTVLVRHAAVVRARLAPAIVLLTAGVSMLGLLHLASYRSLIGGSNDPLITGRYLLPLVALLGLGAGAVVASLPRRIAPYAASVVLVSLVALSIAGLGLSLERFYA
jgi:4-amino-4-deoxy-L-arabinose transferase-like glycosyltransferase